jgi:hypothetical protein
LGVVPVNSLLCHFLPTTNQLSLAYLVCMVGPSFDQPNRRGAVTACPRLTTEAFMQPTHSSRWLFPWVPLGILVVLGGTIAGLFILSPQEAPAAGLSPESAAGFQTTDKLVLTVNVPKLPRDEANLTVQVRDADGKVVVEGKRVVKSTDGESGQRFEFSAPKGGTDKLTLHCRLDREEFKVPLSKVLLVKAHETALSAGQEYFAGSDASLRCEVHGVRSLTETVPLAGASVSVRLIPEAKGAEAVKLYDGKAGANGVADVQFKMPAKPAGAYKLEIITKSTLGEEKLEKPIKLKSAPKVLLVSDKPMYQPGQVIHLRALALKSNDLHAVADSEITFEVEDAKGNKVFKKAMKTSDYGIASVDFQLASEVNNGDYRLRAILGEHTADKTVVVKPYVLPKYKSQLTADKTFYLPKETLKATLQTDYLFGKPVAKAKVKVTASTFDVAFKEFQTWEGKTDESGHAKFEIKLPDYFVGQPLSKGNAIVRLEAKITDSADHTETVTKTFPVSDQPVRVSLIPEGGRVVPAMENRVFAAAIYPDGSPAACEVKLWLGQKADGKPFATLKTNEAGLAEFRLTPKPEQFRLGGWGQHNVELLGGQTQQAWGQQSFLDLFCEANDAKGAKATAVANLTSEPMGENVVLRLDKAIYKGGDSLKIDILTSAGMPTAYLDVVRGGQTMLTKWLDVKDGKAQDKIELPPSVFGTLEIHAYQTLSSGEVIRDCRVVYVQPATDLKIAVEPNKKEYRPGEEGKITFRVTDQKGNPTAAALGVLIVDEAVYALQDMQPGLEKVYFTLQEELLKPQAQVLYRPGEPLDSIVRRDVVPVDKQQIAEVLLTSVRPKAPARWEVNPVIEREQKVQGLVWSIKQALYDQGLNGKFVVFDAKTKTTAFPKDTLKELSKTYGWTDKNLTDPVGGKVTLESLMKVDSSLSAERLAQAVTLWRLHQLTWNFANYANQRQKDWLKDNKWTLPKDALEQFAKAQGWGKDPMNDAWGHPLQIVVSEKKRDHQTGWLLFDHHQIVSVGPDGKLGTDDDVKLVALNDWQQAYSFWMGDHSLRRKENLTRLQAQQWGARGRFRGLEQLEALVERDGMNRFALPGVPKVANGVGGFGQDDMKKFDRAAAKEEKGAGKPAEAGDQKSGNNPSGGAAPPKVREYFPETMLWRPALITDDKGVAVLPVPFADSITTWRLTASASSKGGLLGGTTAPLRVFQDFFVDLDLPLNLTRNDEVAFPVAVYNYLQSPQKVTLTLKAEDWFELTDGQGLTRTVELKAGEVAGVHFRIKARRIGNFPLLIEARGDKLSDAVKRYIEVVPDGRKVEQVVTDRLGGRVVQSIVIPDGSLPDASKLFVKMYPGVFSQVLEGTEGILRMPGGCFEQTSSSAYPNIMAVNYIKRMKLASPAILMKAEQYLNAGYQRLLTFEHKTGGFDWWGQESNPPLVWLSAYGLHEFNDMAQVMPIDKGVITRTQNWLMKQQEADGTWSKIGATHSESIERMGDPKLLLTSYVTWSLLESGYKDDRLKKSIEYIRNEAPKADNAYILALAANALACWDAKDDSTHEVLVKVLKKLDEKKAERTFGKDRVMCYPAGGQSLTYARGDSLTVETTAMAVLAMQKNGQFTNACNNALAYLVKSKDPHGTWGSTQATILALKALVTAAGGNRQKGEATFTILVNGKEAAKGAVNEKNDDVMQSFDLTEHLKAGPNEVVIDVKTDEKAEGQTNLMYQIVGRHYEAWTNKEADKPLFDVAVDYDRTKLSTKDMLKAKATLKYNGKEPTSMVMLDLGIAPGFTVDVGDFAEMVAAKKVNKFSVTARQVILYLGDVKPGEVLTFEYTLKPKYPIKAKTPESTAYEYYTPKNRGTAKPVELVVEEKK